MVIEPASTSRIAASFATSSRTARSGDAATTTVAEPATTLVADAATGDQHAFARLYTAVQPRLLRYAYGLVGQDAEDVTAEAWLQIVRDLRTFEGDDDAFRAWSARIVRNRALDHARARARRPVQTTGDDNVLDTASPSDTALDALDRISTDRAVELIGSLPTDQAEAVLLRVVVGLDAASAGEVLDKSAGAVRVAAHRGLKNLAKQLGA